MAGSWYSKSDPETLSPYFTHIELLIIKNCSTVPGSTCEVCSSLDISSKCKRWRPNDLQSGWKW